MYEPLEKEFKEILDATTKSEMINLIQKHKDHIVHSPNLRNFLKATIYTDNKRLLQAFNETKIFESQEIDYHTRIELLNSIANSYGYAYGGDLKLSHTQLEALQKFKNSDISVVNDEFRRVKSSFKVLEKEHPELIDRLKLHYFPENFPSEVIQMKQININVDKAALKTEVNKAAQELKNSITIMTLLERANHIMAVKNTIDYDFNIYRDKDNEPRFTAEESAIKEFLSDFPDKTSYDYQYIKTAANSAAMLFNFVRGVNDLQKFQKENNNLEPEKLPHDKREQLAKILNRVSHSYNDMVDHDKKLRTLIAQQPNHEMVNKLAPPAPNESIKQRNDTLPSTEQLATKPMLRMVEMVLQETFRKLENAVKDNNKNEFHKLINHMIESASPDQIQSTIKSLQHLNIRITKSSEKNPDPTRGEKLSMLKEGLLSLNKACEKFLAPSQESQPSPSISKRF